VVEALRRASAAGQTVKVVGAAHSFNDIACTNGRQLRLDRLNRVLAVDADAGLVTVQGGIRLWEFIEQLATLGLALPVLGDIDRQSIAGAIATGTHGSSRCHGGLATLVAGLELVTADGSVLRCSPSEEPDVFDCARVGLGALGVVTKVTLRVEPQFRLHSIEASRPVDELIDAFDEIVEANEYVKCYWFPHTPVASVFVANRTQAALRPLSPRKRWRNEGRLPSAAMRAFGAVGRPVPTTMSPMMGLMARGVGSSNVVDDSSRVLCARRRLGFVGAEHAVPRSLLIDAFNRVRHLIETKRLSVDLPVTLTLAAADDIPLSAAYGRDTGYIGVYLSSPRPRHEFDFAVRRLEEATDELEARPHWGKLHLQQADRLARRYPEWSRFRDVRARFDPDGRFGNAYLDRVLGPIA
jgi:L-gulono-1,4-lactone dehydrogenase